MSGEAAGRRRFGRQLALGLLGCASRSVSKGGAAAGAAATVAAGTAAAAVFPQRPVRIVVPYAPGGPADAFARIVARPLGLHWQQPVIVENRAGANGVIGTDHVARSAADGYTLLVGSGATAIAVTLEEKLPYDTLKDLQAVGALAATPYFLFANAQFAPSSVGELIALARQRPEQIRFGSAGSGGVPHLAGEMFNQLAGTRLLHVPYKGTGPATSAMLADEVQLMFGSLTSTQALLKVNRLKVLGTADASRSALMPEIATIAEAGVPGFEAQNWFGLFAPGATPGPVAEAIADALAASLAQPEVRAQMSALGAVPMALRTTAFQAYFRRQVALWAQVIKSRGLTKN